MKEPLAPCKDCKDRYVGCHEKCKAYLDFKEAHEEWAKLVFQNKLEDTRIAQIEVNRFKPYYKHKLYKDKNRGGI